MKKSAHNKSRQYHKQGHFERVFGPKMWLADGQNQVSFQIENCLKTWLANATNDPILNEEFG